MKSILRSIYHNRFLHPAMEMLLHISRVMICRWRYARHLKRIRRKVSRGEKIKVVFLCGNIAKWKTQSLYEEMVKSEMFDPVVALTFPTDFPGDASELVLRIESDEAFFARLGDRTVRACDMERREGLSPLSFGADIVFLQEPWSLFKCQRPLSISRYALTCYVPYSIEWADDTDLHWIQSFHCLLFANFVWDVAQATHEKPKFCSPFCCEIGHPSLDRYYLEPKINGGEYVIYAPHFAFPYKGKVNREILGTFEWNGREMLRYAKRHPEVRWVFKPHPALRWNLEEKGLMTHSEVDFYYAQWEQIGEACYDGDYFDLFRQSRVMITDSCSFLFEYAPTGMPLIRPLAAQFSLHPSVQAKKLFDTYYTVRNWAEMEKVMDAVVVRRDDEMRDVRQRAIKDMHLANSCAAQKVIERLNREFLAGVD